MEALIQYLIDWVRYGVNKLGGEIVFGILCGAVVYLFPSMTKLFRKKDDTEAESQKHFEILRQDISKIQETLERKKESKDKTEKTASDNFDLLPGTADKKKEQPKEEGRIKTELIFEQEELRLAEAKKPQEVIRKTNTEEINRQPQRVQSQHKPEESKLAGRTMPRIKRRELLPRARDVQGLRVSDRAGEAAVQSYLTYQRTHQIKSRRKNNSFFKFIVLIILAVLAFVGVKMFFFGETTDAEEQYELGYKYFSDKNYAEALKWYTLSAEQGLAQAQLNLGVMYCNGYGVSQDYAEAVNLYRKAAGQGYALAQFNLGVMYYNGSGVSQDYAEAVNLYRKAAEQGLVQAQFNLGVMYENGLSVPKNIGEARKWYEKSSAQGYSKSKQALERLK